MNAQALITQLKLQPHPEGGYYRETYRSAAKTHNSQGMERNVSTAIYYLLENADKSHFHRIKSDELWFFHQGQALEIVILNHEGLTSIVLGNNISQAEVPQAVVPAHTWFAARLKEGQGFGLVSCTVAPGFDFLDFEMAQRASLLEEFPQERKAIEAFTR